MVSLSLYILERQQYWIKPVSSSCPPSGPRRWSQPEESQRSLPQGTPQATEINYLETHHVAESFDFKTKKQIIVIIINPPQGTPHAAKIYGLETKTKKRAK